jgi:hypothetical protein
MHDQHTPEAQRLLDELDAELARSSECAGTTLTWTASEREHLAMIADTVDRRVHLQRRHDVCDPTDAKNLVRLSTEIRLCDGLVSRLLKEVHTDTPQPESLRTIKARRAAMRRWHPDATG